MSYIVEAWLDKLANTAATSPHNDYPEPTEAQIKSGNYKKGHIKLHGFSISVENPAGSFRRGIDPNGRPWKTKLRWHYGYIKGTNGADKDHLDCFIGPDRETENVYVVNQKKLDNGKFDEHKILFGFPDLKSALDGYLSNYEKDWDGISSIHSTDLDSLKDWIKNKNTRRPFGY